MEKEEWIREQCMHLNRKTMPIDYTDHLLYEKSVTSSEELEIIEDVVRTGVPFAKKSTPEKNRICFKKYVVQQNRTCFVIVECTPELLILITRMWKNGNA